MNNAKFWYVVFSFVCLIGMIVLGNAPDDDIHQKVYEKSLEQAARAERQEDAD